MDGLADLELVFRRVALPCAPRRKVAPQVAVVPPALTHGRVKSTVSDPSRIPASPLYWRASTPTPMSGMRLRFVRAAIASLASVSCIMILNFGA